MKAQSRTTLLVLRRIARCMVSLGIAAMVLVNEAMSGENPGETNVAKTDKPAAAASVATPTSAEAQTEEPKPDQPVLGSLVIIGGSARNDNQDLWSEVVSLAGGSGSKFAVFPSASRLPEKNGGKAVSLLNEFGADAFLVPMAPTGFDDFDYRELAKDEALVEQVRQSDGIFFIGGSQARIRQVLVDDEGQQTPMLKAIWDVYRRGGVVAGTSAGAAIMSRVMFREAGVVLATMQNGVTMGREIDHGLGFLDPAWFVDQHCLVRGRFARSLVAMQSQQVSYGIGIDEDSALVVKNGTNGQVIGYRGAVVMDLSDAKSDGGIEGFNVKNAKLTYLNRGDSIHLRTLEVTPAQIKADDRKIDPTAPDFKPAISRRLFYNDILANTALLDVMYRVIDHKDGQAIGLAFDGAAAQRGPTSGFEFRFYRDRDSFGWETDTHGRTDCTIKNIHLDIKPIQIHGPLYGDPAPTPPVTPLAQKPGDTPDLPAGK